MENTTENKRSVHHQYSGPVHDGNFQGVGEPKHIGRSEIAAMIGSAYEPWGTERIAKSRIPVVVRVTIEYSDGRRDVWGDGSADGA